MTTAAPDPDLSRVFFNSADVAELARITLRQLQWWDERHVVSPEKDGHRRQYQAREVVALMVVADLRRRGLSLQKIRRLAERSLNREIEKRQHEILIGDSGLYVLTDGDAVHLERRLDRIIGLMKDATRAMFLISLGDVAKKMGDYWVRKESRRKRDQLALF